MIDPIDRAAIDDRPVAVSIIILNDNGRIAPKIREKRFDLGLRPSA